VAGTNFTKVLASLALANLVFGEKTLDFTKSTLELKDLKPSSPQVPPPPLVSVLQTSPPRNRGQLLGIPLPA
jgi:hypothetical protein